MSIDQRKPLSSDAAVKAAELGEHMVTNAPGLILRVRALKDGAITRTWIVRVTVNGHRSRFGLGAYPAVGLARARTKAQDARNEVAEGNDPSVSAKRRARLAEAARSLTLAQAIDGWLATARPYKNAKSDRIRERALRTHFAPLHSRDVAAVTVSDVAAILRKLAPETAVKSHAAIRGVFDYAAATLEHHKVVIVNPADPRRLRSVGWSPKSRSAGKQHPAIDWRVTPSVVAELERIDDIAATCVLFIVATAVRAGTARLAKWDNINFEARTWTPPPTDLKDGKHHQRPFIVPLNDVALEALERMRACSSLRYVFGNCTGGPLTDNDLSNLVRRLRRRHPDWRDLHSGEPFTVHGFRSSFRTFVEDRKREANDLAELSLGHKVRGDVAGRYIRTGLVEERRALLDLWSQHLRSEAGKVIPLRTG